MEKPSSQLHFRVDTPALLKEITEAAIPNSAGVLKTPLNILRNYLIKLSQRASQINDPELNIIMLEMSLYDIKPNEVVKEIEKQKRLIKIKENETTKIKKTRNS